ncbi:MAG: aldo-keto reductase family protein [Candidatus Nezhaarchaeales archaeon]
MLNESKELPIIRKNGVEIARILVGTSPFIAAGQFEKSFQYYVEFVMRRGKVAEILSWCLLHGFSWIQALDVDFIAEEISLAHERTKITPTLIISTWDKPEKAVARFKTSKLRMLLAHASLVDCLNTSLIKRFLAHVENLGLIPGIVTHNPNNVLPRLKHIDEIKVVMVPLNYAGLFNDNVEETLRLLREMKVVVIAKKVLGAGRLPVNKALQWALSRPEIDSLALGIASISEAEQTLNLAYNIACKA